MTVRVPPVVRLVHPAPAAAVVALSAVLALILATEGGAVDPARVLLVVLAVAGSQVVTGATNDWADRARDHGRPDKPIATGTLGPGAALTLAGGGALLQLGASIPLGWAALLLGVAATASALAYNLALSRTPASVVPYLVSFGLLPLWIAAGIDVPLSRVAPASALVLPFAAAAHLANTLRDFEADAAAGSRNLAQVLGRRRAMLLAVGLAAGTGLGVAAALLADARLTWTSATLGGMGLVAVGQGIGSAQRLWIGLLVAAVCWTAAWGLATALA